MGDALDFLQEVASEDITNPGAMLGIALGLALILLAIIGAIVGWCLNRKQGDRT